MKTPCIKCGACERNKYGNCKACLKVSQAAYRARNKEKIRVSNAAYFAANLDKYRAYGAAWRAANPERSRARSAEWRAANEGKSRNSAAAYRARNPDKARAAVAAWVSANPEAAKTHNQNRRARKNLVGGKLSRGLSEKLFALQKGKCACCKRPLGNDYHLDHVMPLALGGPNIDDNIQLLRKMCNHQKHARHPVDFMQQRGFLL